MPAEFGMEAGKRESKKPVLYFELRALCFVRSEKTTNVFLETYRMLI
jgi:hypothetical protein